MHNGNFVYLPQSIQISLKHQKFLPLKRANLCKMVSYLCVEQMTSLY